MLVIFLICACMDHLLYMSFLSPSSAKTSCCGDQCECGDDCKCGAGCPKGRDAFLYGLINLPLFISLFLHLAKASCCGDQCECGDDCKCGAGCPVGRPSKWSTVFLHLSSSFHETYHDCIAAAAKPCCSEGNKCECGDKCECGPQCKGQESKSKR